MSSVNPDAPLVDDDVRRAFTSSPQLRATLGSAFERMLAFYGLTRDGDRIVRAPSFATQRANWLRPGNHNHLRLSRILRSLTLLGRGEDTEALLACLLAIAQEFPSRVASSTVGYWRRAGARDPSS